MTDSVPELFDFQDFAADSEGYRQLLKDFAAGPAFRSAAVEELVLDNDFFRRPLRPEDLEFLTFKKPVQAATVSRLPSLASQRTLLSLYELTSAVPPPGADPGPIAAFTQFASERNRLYAARLAPFLEAYAFDYLGRSQLAGEATSYSGLLGRIYADEYQFWIRLFGQLHASDYFQDGLRFILIQRWCLAGSKRKALEQVRALGHFAGWPVGIAPSLESRLVNDDEMQRLATQLGVARTQHSYWQFYLSTSLAKCNLLHAFARRSEQCFALYGALYAAQAEHLAFEAAVAQCCPHMIGNRRIEAGDSTHIDGLLRHFESALRLVQQQHAGAAAIQMGQGLAAAVKLAERGRWDLGEQLKWLSAIERYCAHARTISRRIEVECPDIDRETFVEPRDMCSTTHVHNDHRLVTIQEGVMHFWGNLSMRLEMHPGDMVLIPEGRLHGSTVLSPECTYHQPIIPDAWIRELIAQPTMSDRNVRPLSHNGVSHASESV